MSRPCIGKNATALEVLLHFSECLAFVGDKENWYELGLPDGATVDFVMVSRYATPQKFPLADGVTYEVLSVSDLDDGRLLGRNPYWVLVPHDLDADLVETIRRRVASRFLGIHCPKDAFPCVWIIKEVPIDD